MVMYTETPPLDETGTEKPSVNTSTGKSCSYQTGTPESLTISIQTPTTTEGPTFKSLRNQKTFDLLIGGGTVSGIGSSFLLLQTMTNIPFSDVLNPNPLTNFLSLLLGVVSVYLFILSDTP